MIPFIATNRPRRIMVCTADHDLADYLAQGLSQRGLAVITAIDSSGVMAQLRNSPPDMMLCDQTLPGHEGMALLQMIRRERTDLASMPIFIMSDFGTRDDIVAGKLAGADDFIVKPVDTELLVASFEVQLRLASRLRSAILTDANPGPASHRLQVLHALLDRFSFGVILYDTHGQPFFTNSTARQLSRANAATIRAWISRYAAQAGHDPVSYETGQSRTLDFRMIPTGVSRSNLAQHLFVATLELSDSDGTEPVFAAVIFPSMHNGLLGSRLVAKAIGLTPTETRLASYLAEGMRLDQITGVMGIARPTVNYHLRNIYQKGGVSRQSDLINLLRAVHLIELSEARALHPSPES
ncbi:MAG: response regulator [Paracoccus sp. (in: a-proteobacteria)]